MITVEEEESCGKCNKKTCKQCYPINNFKKYGFTADFEGKIHEKIENEYIGYYKKFRNYGKVDSKYNQYIIYPCKWGLDGKCKTILEGDSNYDSCGDLQEDYNLTPIVKPWYEIENSCRVVIMELGTDKEFTGMLYYDDFLENTTLWEFEGKRWRLATDEEIDKLKRGIK